MLKKVLIGLAAVVVIFVIYIEMQPSHFRIERRTTVRAPAEKVFAQVNNFHNWQGWSPWAKRDPKAKNSFSGPKAGTGASFAWAGNQEVGEGKMTITESVPHTFIRIQLDFLKPFKSNSTAEFSFIPEESDTLVSWAMVGKSNFIHKLACLFMDMDAMVGADFEKGLASMKEIAESATKAKQ